MKQEMRVSFGVGNYLKHDHFPWPRQEG